MRGSSKNVLLRLIILLLVLCLSSVFIPDSAYTSAEDSDQARSPPFPNQEIIDPNLDFIHMNNRTLTTSGDRSTDIMAVDYHSDGKELYAILWLYFPFQPEQPSLNEEVNYGMYIDADFDSTTGFGGIEYKVEISWDNQTKNWTRILEKWSHFGDSIVLVNQTIPYTDFSKVDAHYVTLAVDLNELLSPKKYKVIFYGEVRREGFLITDFTRLIAIPPLELGVSTSPNSVELRKGESKTIEVKVNTTQGYEPTVNINAKSQTGDLVLGFAQKQIANEVWNLSSKTPVQVLQVFTQNDTSLKPDIKLRIPSYGVATIPLTITSRESSLVGPYTIFIFVNSSFPPEEFLKPTPIKERASTFLPQSVLTPENIFTQSSLLVTLSDRLPWIDYVGDLWNKLGGPLSFAVGIIAGNIGPWIFKKMRDWSKGRKLGKQKTL